jgi:hypothetical protein
MQKKVIVLTAIISYCCILNVNAQMTLISSFNPADASTLCGIGYDPGTAQVWVYGCSASSILCYSTTGVLLNSFTAPGGTANDVDVEVAPEALTLSNTSIPEGQLLFVNGESGVAEIYAINNTTGSTIQTLNTAFGASHVVGGSYHPTRHTFFLVQDNVPSSSLENMIAEIDPLTGNILQSFQITSTFTVSYGDIEVGANGNLFVVSNVEDSMAEYTPLGSLVKMHAYPVGVSSLSGIAIDCAAGEAWVSGQSGTVYHLGQFPGGSPLTPTISAGGPTTFCKGGEVTLSVDAPGGLSYAWKKGSSFISGATDPTYVATKSGMYSCQVSNACESELSNKISVTANPKPEAAFTQGTCSGGAVLLTRTGTPTTGVTYKWKLNNNNISGATNATYSATASGSYKVEVKITATGCKKTSPAQNVTINCKMGNDDGFNAQAYPNPFYKSVTIKIGSISTSTINCNLTDFSGKIIREYRNVEPNSSLEIKEDLAPGVYFVQLHSEERLLQTLKVVKVE